MANIKLNIYKTGNKKEIEKTYTATSYELMFGTIEDVLDTIDIDKVGDKVEFAKMIFACFAKLKPIILDIFPDMKEEELKRVKVAEIVPMFTEVVNAITENIGILNAGN